MPMVMIEAQGEAEGVYHTDGIILFRHLNYKCL